MALERVRDTADGRRSDSHPSTREKMAKTVTLIRVREHGREHEVRLRAALGPAGRRALADRFGLVEGQDIWFEERQSDSDPGKSGTLSIGLPEDEKAG